MGSRELERNTHLWTLDSAFIGTRIPCHKPGSNIGCSVLAGPRILTVRYCDTANWSVSRSNLTDPLDSLLPCVCRSCKRTSERYSRDLLQVSHTDRRILLIQLRFLVLWRISDCATAVRRPLS